MPAFSHTTRQGTHTTRHIRAALLNAFLLVLLGDGARARVGRHAKGPKKSGVRVEGSDALRQSAPGARTAQRTVATGGGERMDTGAKRASVPAEPLEQVLRAKPWR